MKNKAILIFLVTIGFLIILLAATFKLLNEKPILNDAHKTSEIKNDLLYAQIEKLEYNKKDDKLDITLSTNFLDFSFANVTIYDSSDQKIVQTSATIMNGQFNAPADTYKTSIKEGEYYAVLSVDVDKNGSFVSNKKVIEEYGNAHDISIAVEGNESVAVKSESKDKFSIYINTNNKVPITGVLAE
ncbi:TPA: hypothetical protein QCZ04_003465 [Bacillus cereus]|nr:hypothetical protein [Bacillus cereus]